MDFMELFVKTVAELPKVIEGSEELVGLKNGEQKKAAAMEVVEAAIGVANAVSS